MTAPLRGRGSRSRRSHRQRSQPGDKIGDMQVVEGPIPFDLNLTHYGAYCNANPMLDLGSTVAKPGAL